MKHAVCPNFLSLEVEWAPPVLSLAQGSRWSTIKGVWRYGWMPGFLSPWIFHSAAATPLVIDSECFHTSRILCPAPRWGPAVAQPDLRCRWILLGETDIRSLEGSREMSSCGAGWGRGRRGAENWEDLYECFPLVVTGKYSYNLGLSTSANSVYLQLDSHILCSCWKLVLCLSEAIMFYFSSKYCSLKPQ